MSAELVGMIIAGRAVYRPTHGSVFGRLPGERYSWQLYLSNVLSDNQFLDLVFDRLIEQTAGLVNWNNVQLAGQQTTADCLLAALTSRLWHHYKINVNYLLVRPQRKRYGRQNFIEGLSDGKPILLIDQIANSHGGLAHAYQVLSTELNATILPFVFVLLNKSTKPNDKHLRSHKIISACTIEDVDVIIACGQN